MDNKQNKFNKINKCEIKFSKQLFPHNFNNLNNLKTAKYFTISNSESQIKKALTKYRENNYKKNIITNNYNLNNFANKTTSTSDITKIIPQKIVKNNNKNKSFKIDKKILNYAEPRTKVKEFHKIPPKIIESFISENNINYENFLQNDEETIINEDDDITSSAFDIIDDFPGINKFKNYNECSNTNINIISIEKEYFLTEIDNKNNLNEMLNTNDINLEYLIMIEKLYDELIKDIEINKMDIYQNKLSIVKDLLYIYNSTTNNNLYNIIDNIILDNENILFFNSNNNTFNSKYQNNNNNLKNSNYYIFLIIKEYLIIQIIFFYSLILISLIKKEKNIFQSGLHSISFYFHQNIIIFIYIIISHFKLINSKDENLEKCKKLLNENKTWLDKNNYKKYIKTNNTLSKQIILNLLKQIKTNININKNINNNKIIESIIDILGTYLISYKKRKILNIIQELRTNSSIKNLFQKLNFHKIISHYNENNINSNETNKLQISLEEPPKPPYLSPISSKYKYTLVLDLDETLVHYVSDNDSAYIQIRPGAEEFIKELSEFYEIIIFTAALQNYADLIISGLDPDGVVSDKLYRQHTINIGNSYIKDLEKLGRDIKKIIIIDNISENFSQQPENGLNIIDFEGNEYDDELKFLKEDLIKLVKLKPDDVRYYLKDIQKKMDKRAVLFKTLNDRAKSDEKNYYDNNLFDDIINDNND